MNFVNLEILRCKMFWIVLSCILIFSLVVAFIMEKKNKKMLEKKVVYLKNEASNYKECNQALINSNNQLKEQIAILEEELDGVSEFNYDNEKIKINPIYKGKRVLVADYDVKLRKIIRAKLRSYGLYVDMVKGGQDIIEKIKTDYKCDLIITNNVFKDHTSGSQVLAILKGMEGFKTPIVIHTVSHNQKSEFLSLGFDDYLEKQASKEELEKILKKFL